MQGREPAPDATALSKPSAACEARLAELEAVAALVADEFANLLAPVLGNVTLLEEELPAAHPLRKRAEGIRDAAMAARGFARRLALLDTKRKLSLHRIEAGALLDGCLLAMREPLPAELTLEPAPSELHDLVRVDRKLIEHALVELARNARDAMSGPGVVRVDAVVVVGEDGSLPAGRWLRLRVRDQGRGMERSLLERAFDPFVTTKVPCGGVGIGLSVVAAVARQHGGFVEAESQPGRGTAVSMYLPCLDTLAAPPELTPPPVVVTTPAPATVPGAAVLLVEDNAMVRRSIEATLRSVGYQVTSVDSGERCLESVGRPDLRVDLLISDVVMPEMSGEEMIGRVHELRPDLPVLFISGYDRSTLARRKNAAACEHFLQKPFDSEDLFAAVREAMASRPGQCGE